MAKSLIVTVRDRDTSKRVATWTDASFGSFDWPINGGLGELTIELARDVRDFGEGADVKLGNTVQVDIHDRESPSEGITIYRGYIHAYDLAVQGNKQKIIVRAVGHQSRFGSRILEDSSGTTTLTYSGQDTAYIFKDIIAKAGLTVTTTSTSVDNSGVTPTVTFQANTITEALDKVVELSGEQFYWYVDATNTAYMRRLDTRRINHVFTFGKHFSAMRASKTIEGMVNEVLFVGGGSPNLYRRYTATGSQSSFGKYQKRVTDQRVTVAATAQQYAAFETNRYDHPVTTVAFTLADSNVDGEWGYDIDLLKPGDLVSIENIVERGLTLWDEFLWDVDSWDYSVVTSLAQPQIIRRITYSMGRAEIEVGNVSDTIINRMVEISRKVDVAQFEDLPTQPS